MVIQLLCVLNALKVVYHYTCKNIIYLITGSYKLYDGYSSQSGVFTTTGVNVFTITGVNVFTITGVSEFACHCPYMCMYLITGSCKRCGYSSPSGVFTTSGNNLLLNYGASSSYSSDNFDMIITAYHTGTV